MTITLTQTESLGCLESWYCKLKFHTKKQCWNWHNRLILLHFLTLRTYSSRSHFTKSSKIMWEWWELRRTNHLFYYLNLFLFVVYPSFPKSWITADFKYCSVLRILFHWLWLTNLNITATFLWTREVSQNTRSAKHSTVQRNVI